MGLYKTALRLATLEALRPTAQLAAEAPAWPTLAGRHVYDSRIDPIEDLSPAKCQPVIAVYTEFDEGFSSQVAGPPFRRIVDLVFEIGQVARATDADGVPTEDYAAGFPATDAELEAELDRIESEIALALLYAPSGYLWRRLTGRMVRDPRTHAYRDSEDGTRLARRTVTWKVQVDDDLADAAPAVMPTGLDRLPEPLRGVVAALAETAYGHGLAAGLAAGMPVMPTAVPLETVAFDIDVATPAGVITTTTPGTPGTADIAAAATDLDA